MLPTRDQRVRLPPITILHPAFILLAKRPQRLGAHVAKDAFGMGYEIRPVRRHALAQLAGNVVFAWARNQPVGESGGTRTDLLLFLLFDYGLHAAGGIWFATGEEEFGVVGGIMLEIDLGVGFAVEGDAFLAAVVGGIFAVVVRGEIGVVLAR